jgi:hypothetical protein
MTAPEGESLEDALRDIDRLAKEEELATGHIPNPFHVAMMKGMLRAAVSSSGRAFKFLLDPTNADALDKIRTPAGRNEFRERLAGTLENGSVAENRRIVEECSWYAALTPKLKAEMLRATKQRELAASIRAEVEPSDDSAAAASQVAAPPRGLNASERVKLARALKFAGTQFDFDRLLKARLEEDWETFSELAIRLQLSVVLALIPPPPGEPFGRRNRSEMWLRTDRKHCPIPGCEKVVSNRAKYCRDHARLPRQERDRQRKGKDRARRKRIATEQWASLADTGASG